MATNRSRDLVPAVELPGREFQELWFTLARRNWRSVVFVPADATGSAGAVALALGEVGRWLRENPVTFVMKDVLDYGSGAQIVARAAGQPPATKAQNGPPAGRVIVAIQPVIVEPLGLGLVQAADATIVCVELGRTRISAAKKTIDLIGRDRIAGCFLVT